MKVTDENVDEMARAVAIKYFPPGTLVRWAFVYDEFGVVNSISKTGKITVETVDTEIAKVTDNEDTGGTYAKLWRRPEDFKPAKKPERRRFTARHYNGDDWEKRGYSSPICFGQTVANRYVILTKVVADENGYIVEESYSP